MTDNFDTDSLLDEALAPAQRRAEVEAEGCVIHATSTSQLVTPVDIIGGGAASEDLSLYPDGYQPLIVDGVALPRCASERVRAMSPEKRAEWEKKRFLAKSDPLWLANNLMEMELQENPHRALFNLLPKMQPGLPISQLSEHIKKFMILWPRGCAKTSAARTLIVQYILNYPNIRICFLTGGKELGKVQLAAVKKYFENPTSAFLELFPEFCLNPKSRKDKKTGQWTDVAMEMGTTEHFTVPANTSRVAVEHTMTIVTPAMALSGAHFDIICIDDLVHNKNYRSATQLANCYQDYKDASPLLDPAGMIFMFGTRYAKNDTYGLIQETAAEMGGLSVWKFSIRNCWSKGPCATCGHYEVFHDREVNASLQNQPCTHAGCECKGFVDTGVDDVLFPAVIKKDGNPFGHTMGFLKRELADKGMPWFALQYLNSPQDTGECTFTEALIAQQTLHHQEQMPPFNGSVEYACGDLAQSTGNDRDETVVMLFTKWQGQLFVFGCIFGRWSHNDQVESILRLLYARRPTFLFLEKGPNYEAVGDNLKMRAPEFNLAIAPPIYWTDLSNQKNAKIIRTANIEVALKSKRLWLCSWMPGYQRLVNQLLEFPNSTHDDFSDCLSQIVAAPTGYQNDMPPALVPKRPGWFPPSGGGDDDGGDSGSFGGSNSPCGMN
jgi:phage terminase large subunit-like protein